MISTLVIVARKKVVENAKNSKNLGTIAEVGEDGKNLRSNLVQVLCIQYPIVIQIKFGLPLFDSSNKINTIHPNFAKELGLSIKPTNVGA